jgi:RuvB-like protein 2
MIVTASLSAEKRESAKMEIDDIKRVYRLFVDVKRSTQYLMEYSKEFMFNELDDHAADYGVNNDGDEVLNGGENNLSPDEKDNTTMETSPLKY